MSAPTRLDQKTSAWNYDAPPGLTCARCNRPFGATLATATDDGWVHAGRCPRICSIEGCTRRIEARGWCRRHWDAWRTHGDPLARNVLRDHDLEDLAFMAATGESWDGACRRLGVQPKTLERFAMRRGRHDLLAAFRVWTAA